MDTPEEDKLFLKNKSLREENARLQALVIKLTEEQIILRRQIELVKGE